MDGTIDGKRAVLDLFGASCTSCAIAIEHAGRRIAGITDIYIDRATSTIQIEYDGDDSALTRICDIVDRLGYEAKVRTSAPADQG